MASTLSRLLLLVLSSASAYQVNQIIRIPRGESIVLDRLQLDYQFDVVSVFALHPRETLCSEYKNKATVDTQYLDKLNSDLSSCVANASCRSLDWLPSLVLSARCKGDSGYTNASEILLRCEYSTESAFLNGSVSGTTATISISTANISWNPGFDVVVSNIVPVTDTPIISLHEKIYRTSKKTLSKLINSCRPPCVSIEIQAKSFGYQYREDYDEDDSDSSSKALRDLMEDSENPNLISLLIFYHHENVSTESVHDPRSSDCEGEGHWKSTAVAFIVLFTLLLVALVVAFLVKCVYLRNKRMKDKELSTPRTGIDPRARVPSDNQYETPRAANPYASRTLVRDLPKDLPPPPRSFYIDSRSRMEDDHPQSYNNPSFHTEESATDTHKTKGGDESSTNNNFLRANTGTKANRDDIPSYVEFLPAE